MFGGIFDFSPKPDTFTLKTIYPLRTERSLIPGNPQGFIMGALEFTQDITGDYQKVVDFQRIIIVTCAPSAESSRASKRPSVVPPKTSTFIVWPHSPAA